MKAPRTAWAWLDSDEAAPVMMFILCGIVAVLCIIAAVAMRP